MALFRRAGAALSHEGKVTHLTANLTSTFPSPDTPDPSSASTTSTATVDAWFDPTKPVVRVEHREPPDSKPDVNFLGVDSGMSPETPTGIVLLWALATQPNVSTVPPGFTIHAGVQNGNPVTVLEYSMDATSETAAQSAKVVFDARDLPVAETRVGTGDDAGYEQRITYQTELVDPATLPDGFIEAAPSPGSPIEELSTQVADLARQGLEVMWLGPTYKGLDFQYLAPDTFPAPMAGISYGSTSSAGTLQSLSLTETAVASWPTVQANLPGLAQIATAGTPVPGLGDKAFLSTELGMSALVVYQGDTITIIQLDAPAGDARAELIEAAKALRPFGST
jgi:hypothetical protein